PKALSLGGQLAIAFGARGHGGGFTGGSAAAHYEPDRAVFNLTRLNGAGSAAHEWFHALDHYFGYQNQGKTLETNDEGRVARFIEKSGNKSMYLSQRRNYRFSGPVDKARPELRQAFQRVVDTIYRQPKIVEVSLDRYEKQLESAQKNIDIYLKRLRDYLGRERAYGRKRKPATAEQLTAYDALAERVRKLDLGEDVRISRPNAGKWTGPIVVPEVFAEMDKIHKAVTGRSELAGTDRELTRLAGYARQAVGAVANLEKYRADNKEERQTPTQYYYDAKDLDDMRSSDYWSTNHEMAARAFESYVEDKLAARGDKSQYLVHSTGNAAYEMTLFELLSGKKPYPEGAERERINQAFDDLFRTIETVEDETGAINLKSVVPL
ncbi:MAG TPA: hypothetical protein PKO33_17545, partial [Pyrinomonadaceae bacterium]|nr:hypothetical protein [Pyrinomonadaceae bacterium]